MQFKLIATLLIFHQLITAQRTTEPYLDVDFKTLQTYKTGEPLSYPVIELSTNQSISIHFDGLGANEKNLSYRIYHCDALWNISKIALNEYANGFLENYIENYRFSLNTTTSYVHYQLEIPNNDIQLKISGNYVVEIFETHNPGKILVRTRFFVVEPLFDIGAKIDFNTTKGMRNFYQQVHFNINTNNIIIKDPYNEIKCVVTKNNDYQQRIIVNSPSYIEHNNLVFNYINALIFDAGDEYSYFDCSSTQFSGPGIDRVTFFAPYYHIDLLADVFNRTKAYQFRYDVNGRMFLRKQETDIQYANTEADYVVVHFTIKANKEDAFQNVFVEGDFCTGQRTDNFKMIYNEEFSAYQASVLLKQGHYDYKYTVKTNSGEIVPSKLTPNYYLTENEYQIYSYYKPLGSRYDRLVGFNSFDSLRDR